MTATSPGPATAAGSLAGSGPVTGSGATTVGGRAEVLERLLGDPWDEANPLGFGPVLAADEHAWRFTAGERALDEHGLDAEFVPVGLGGQLRRLDELVELLRAVFRRDPGLGLGYGAGSFLAAVDVWADGTQQQRRRVADLLLSHRRLAAAGHRIDVRGSRLRATPRPGGGFLLEGRGEMVAGADRAAAIVLFAGTDHRAGGRIQLLVEPDQLPAARVRRTEPVKTVGMRSLSLGGVDFDSCPVPNTAVLGTPGRQPGIASSVLSRVVLPAVLTGILDTGLRTCVRHLSTRRLYGRPATELPEVRTALAGAHADLLLGEAFTGVAIRALHLAPDAAGSWADAVTYLVPRVLLDAMTRLSMLLGAYFYLREGPASIFQKLLRDLQSAGVGGPGWAAGQCTPVAPGRHSPSGGRPLPQAVFELQAPLPEIRLDRLPPEGAGDDSLSALLATTCGSDPDLAPAYPQVRTIIDALAEQQRRPAAPDARQPRRSVNLLAGAACLGIWRAAGPNPDPFLRDPAWLAAVLARLPVQAAGPVPRLPEALSHVLYAELIERCASGTSLGLIRRRLADHDPREVLT